MPRIMNMPKIGVNMEDAVIVNWVVKEGDAIREGDHILDAETDKAIQEIFATDSGIIARILVQAGETARCHEPLLVLRDDGESCESADIDKLTGKILKTDSTKSEPDKEKPLTDTSIKEIKGKEALSERIKISPLAKKMAMDMGIDYKAILPAEPGTRITKSDILEYIERDTKEGMASPDDMYKYVPYADNSVIDTIPLSGVRKVIAERMTQSNITKPCVDLTLEVDATMLIKWRESLKRQGNNTSYNDLMVVIAARALKEFPIMNSVIDDEGIHLLRDINIGVAVDSERGLVVPVIRNAYGKSVFEISAELRDKVERVRSNKIKPDETKGGTFTITNLGMYEIEQFNPVVSPAECCILALGAIKRKPVVVDNNDSIGVLPIMKLTLVFDHRIVDGAPAARFLQRIKCLVENPLELLS